MDMRKDITGWSWVLAAALVGGLASVAQAVDGVVLIKQAKALAGNVTPGDTPGFPVTISLPGSYRLEGNLTVRNAETTAIHITADNVTLDLNGFTIFGSMVCLVAPGTPCPTDGQGVDATDRDNVAVVNGTVRGMGSTGVRVGNNGRVEKVRAVKNGGTGIIAGQGSTVIGNTVQGNGGFGGIFAGPNSIVQGNAAQGNLADGIHASFGNTVQGNTANLNGRDGIFADVGSTVIGNTARQNGRFGLGLAASTFPNDDIGYAHNVLSHNGDGNAFGGTSLGQNLCNGALC